MATSPIVTGSNGKGLMMYCGSAVQIHAAAPLRMISSAIVAMTIVSWPDFASGRMIAP